MGVAFTFSNGIRRLPGLASLLGVERVRWALSPLVLPSSAGDFLVGWGRKRSFQRAEAHARRHGMRCLSLEDGFLRSVGLGDDELPLSIVVDDLGIYYDANAPSRLETLVASAHSARQRARACALVAQWRDARVSKYNHAREALSIPTGPYVLAVDQTLEDASIQYGLAAASSFRRMLDAAVMENRNCAVLLKLHPDVVAGRKRGHFDLHELERMPRVHVFADGVHPVSLIEHAEAVYTVTSQMGFEALLWGKKVRTFGMPFYAGWGLTQDDVPAPLRRRAVVLEDLVHAALIEYPRYLDPETGMRCEPERLIEWMGLQRRMRERFPPQVRALGFSLWKRPIVRAFFQGSEVRFGRSTSTLPQHGACVVWGSRAPVDDLLSPRGAGDNECELIHLEDGFLRSVGLGVDLVRPVSWAMDRRGLYYDATRPSDLEHLLQNCRFSSGILERAAALRQRIVAAGLTKYNLGGTRWQRPPGEQRVILVPGQVETDASLARGAPGIRRNIDLLRAVREACPGAWVVYKPHPDVVAGLRRRGEGESEAACCCDEIIHDVDTGTLLERVDEVHVLTSLTGFEALLRGRKVVTWGQPFYSGWGLTEDCEPVERRQRKLTLDELVAGALILYPAYLSRTTARFTSPERALDELIEWKAAQTGLPFWRKLIRVGLRYVKGR